jgi:hypothetical protein
MGEMVENVMLNLFQHLMESISYETLKRVQGDKNELRHSLSMGEGEGGGGQKRHALHLVPPPHHPLPLGEGRIFRVSCEC